MDDYTSKDFIDTYQKFLDLVKELNGRWDPSVSNEADPGVVLLKLIALTKDHLDYKIDMAQAQAYLGSVSDRQSAFELLQMLGYTMKNAKSASGFIQVSSAKKERKIGDKGVEEVCIANIDLPIFTVITDDSNTVSFFTTKPVKNISSGTLVEVMEGSIIDLTKEGVDKFSLKDVDESGRFFLQKSGIAQNGVFIGVIETINKQQQTEQVNWTKWSNIDSNTICPKGNYFFVATSETGENYIQFPDNFAELINSEEFYVKFTMTKGSRGNINKGTLTKVFEISSKIDASASDFRVIQLADILSGEDEESIKHAEKTYYSTTDVINTLVSNHDYTAAIRYAIRNGVRLFSNVSCRTANDRQEQIITMVPKGDTEYIHYAFDDSKPDRDIDTVCLKNSNNYSESYQIQEKDDELSSYLNGLLCQSTSVGANICLTTEGRFLAVTNLVGTILANITTKEQSDEVLDKVFKSIQLAYNAANVEFGEDLNYQELMEIIKKSDPRIINVTLRKPEFKIYKEYQQVDGKTTELDEDTRVEFVAKAVLQGKIPLFSYLNYEPNPKKQSHAIAAGFGTAEYKSLNSGNPFRLKIKITPANLFNTGEDGFTLSGPQVLQIAEKVKIEDLTFSYGTRYAFITNGRSSSYAEVKEDVTITSPMTFKSGNLLYLEGEVSQDLKNAGIYDPLNNSVDLNMDYTLQKQVRLKAGSILSGTIIPDDVEIVFKGNPRELSIPMIPADTKYCLKEGEKLILSVGGERTEYEKGTWVLISGLVIKSNGPDASIISRSSQILGATQSITILKDEDSVITKGLKYFLRLNNYVKSLTLNNNNKFYILQDGEYFVYTDIALTEYIILGPGTMLERNEDVDITLDNIIQIDNINDASYQVFKPLSNDIKATSMQITSMSKENGYSFKFEAKEGASIFTKMSWQNLDDMGKIICSKTDNNTKEVFNEVFDKGFIRLIYVLKSGINNLIELNGSKNDTDSIEISDNDSNNVLFQAPSLDLSINLNTIHCLACPFPTIFILSNDEGQLISNEPNIYGRCERSDVVSQSSYLNYTVLENGLKIKLPPKEKGKDLSSVTVSSSLLDNTKYVMCRIYVEGLEKDRYVYISMKDKDSKCLTPFVLFDPTEKNSTLTSTLDSNIVLRITETSNVVVLFEIGKTKTTFNIRIDGDEGSEITIDKVRFISGYTDEIKASLNLNSIDIEKDDLYQTIKTLNKDRKFCWINNTSNLVQDVLDFNEFLNKEHPANLNTITYIDIEKSKETLKIMPITGVLK